MAYMAYLLSGWDYFLEEMQFLATSNFLGQGGLPRQKLKRVGIPPGEVSGGSLAERRRTGRYPDSSPLIGRCGEGVRQAPLRSSLKIGSLLHGEAPAAETDTFLPG